MRRQTVWKDLDRLLNLSLTFFVSFYKRTLGSPRSPWSTIRHRLCTTTCSWKLWEIYHNFRQAYRHNDAHALEIQTEVSMGLQKWQHNTVQNTPSSLRLFFASMKAVDRAVNSGLRPSTTFVSKSMAWEGRHTNTACYKPVQKTSLNFTLRDWCNNTTPPSLPHFLWYNSKI